MLNLFGCCGSKLAGKHYLVLQITVRITGRWAIGQHNIAHSMTRHNALKTTLPRSNNHAFIPDYTLLMQSVIWDEHGKNTIFSLFIPDIMLDKCVKYGMNVGDANPRDLHLTLMVVKSHDRNFCMVCHECINFYCEPMSVMCIQHILQL